MSNFGTHFKYANHALFSLFGTKRESGTMDCKISLLGQHVTERAKL